MYAFKRGQTSVVIRVKLLDSSVTTGAGKTGLTSASSGLIISTIADNESAATAYTVAGSTIESITTLGTYATPTATKCRFKEVDATNHPGVYEIQLADARFAVSSAKTLLISVLGVANLAQCDLLVSLLDVDPYDAVRGGMTALPNANAEAAGGLYTRGSGAGQINQNANGQVDTRTVTMSNGVVTASAIATDAVDADALAADAVAEIQSGLSTLNAAGVRSAVGLASANLDTQLAAIAGFIDTEVATIVTAVAAIQAKTDNLPATPAAAGDQMALTSGGVDAVLDEVVEGSTTVRQMLRGFASALLAKCNGLGGTSVAFRDLADTKDRIAGTVDADGNRSAVSLDLT